MIYISANFKDSKNADHILKTYNLCMIHFLSFYQISEIKDDFQVVSQFPCLLGHPVSTLDCYTIGISRTKFLECYTCRTT